MTGNNPTPAPSSESPSTRPSGIPNFRLVPGRGLDERKKAPPPRITQSNRTNVPNRPLTGLQNAQSRAPPSNRQPLNTIRSSPNIVKPLDRRRSDFSASHHSPASDTERVSESLSFLRSVLSSATIADERRSASGGTQFRAASVKMINDLLSARMSVDSFIDSLSKLFNSTTCFVYAPLLKKSIEGIQKSARKGEIDIDRIMLAKVPDSMKDLLLNQNQSVKSIKIGGPQRSASIGQSPVTTIPQGIISSQSLYKPRTTAAPITMDQIAGRSAWIKKRVHGTEFFATFMQQYSGSYEDNIAAIDNLLWSILNANSTKMSVDDCVHRLQSLVQAPLPSMRSFLCGVLPTVRQALQLPAVDSPPSATKSISVQQVAISQPEVLQRPLAEVPPFQNEHSISVKRVPLLAPQDIDLGSSTYSDVLDNYDISTPCPNITKTKLRFLDEGNYKASLLPSENILHRIRRELGPTIPIDDDVAVLISDATEYLLKELLYDATNLAEHRMTQLQLNPNYVIVDDSKHTMEFNDTVDSQEAIFPKRINSISVNELHMYEQNSQFDDCQTERLAELWKGIPPKQKWDQIGKKAMIRPRIVTVNIHDLYAVVRHNSFLSRSQLKHRFSLCGDIWRSHI